MNKEYYSEYFELERSHWWFRVREKIIKDVLEQSIDNNTTLKILNVGAATGKTSEMLGNYGTVTSIEYDKDCCDFTSKRLGIEIINASVLDLPFADNSFDLVCAFDIIEHVEDDFKAVTEMHRVCKSNGLIYVTVPAFQKLWSHHDVVNQHFRRYVMSGVENLFKHLKGKRVFKTYFNSLLFIPIFCFRVLSNIFGSENRRSGSGSDFSALSKDSLIDKVLFNIFMIERYLLRKTTFPVGVSALFIWKKVDL